MEYIPIKYFKHVSKSRLKSQNKETNRIKLLTLPFKSNPICHFFFSSSDCDYLVKSTDQRTKY